MNLKEAVVSAFKNYANFKGRARRSEYWYFSLFSLIVIVLALILGAIIDNIAQELTGIGLGIIVLYGVATIVPNLSVTCRRLHDVGKSGAYVFFFLLPIVGEILVWVWSFQDGQPWTNQYGPDPKGRNMTPFGMPGTPGYGYPGYGYVPENHTSTEKDNPSKPQKKCSNCGATIDGEVVFCPICGHDTRVTKAKIEPDPSKISRDRSETKVCVNCGNTIDVKVAFCPFCGENPTMKKRETTPATENHKPSKGFSAPTDLD